MLRGVQGVAASVFALTVAAAIPFFAERGVEPSGDAVLWTLYGVGAATAILWVVATLLLHRQEPEAVVASAPARGYGEPRNREELRDWLDVRIEEIVAWRAVLDNEAAQPVPNIDITGSIETMFWNGLNNEVHRKLHLLAPEWTGYWGESPEWFFAGMTRITSEQVAEFSRMLGWSAERLRHIKRELP